MTINRKDTENKYYAEIVEDLTTPELESSYFNETPENLFFKSDSLFTDKFKSDLRSILNSDDPDAGRKFKKKSAYDKREVVKELDELLQSECVWKDMVKTSKYNNKKVELLFPNELEQFKSEFSLRFFAEKTMTKRKASNFGSERCKIFFKGFLEYIQLE